MNASTATDRECRYLIAIDDTDNLESRGTGFRARQLGASLMAEGLAELVGITRHQLFVSPEIPYTSHNSSACLDVRSRVATPEILRDRCGAFLLAESAPGSDAGLCIANDDDVGASVREFGSRAKREVLTQEDARRLAAEEGLLLSGYTGTQGGVIGALAAVGLRKGGADGRFLWVRGLRELECATYRIDQLLDNTGIDELRTVDGELVPSSGERLQVDWQPRPVLLDGKAILLVEKQHEHPSCEWRLVAKDVVKRY